MDDPGLTTRLRQHSRRAGIAVGLSMAITIAICVGIPVVIYAQLTPFTTDFTGADVDSDPLPTSAPRPTSTSRETAAQPTEVPQQAPPTPTAVPPTPTPPAFVATLVVDSSVAVNFRSAPDRTQDNVLAVLDPGTTLRYLGEQQTEVAYGENWLRCELEDGTQGWVLETATSPIEEAG